MEPASAPASPSSPKPPLELAVGAAAGLLIGGLTVLAGVGRSARPVPVTDHRVPPPPVIAAPATRAITFYPQTQYYGDGYNGEKIVGRAVVLPREPR